MYNTLCMVLFSKTAVRICLDAHIRTIVVCNDALFAFTFCNLLFCNDAPTKR
jgi:hypothetical protein